MKKILIISFLLMGISGSGLAQTLPFRSYSIENGLSESVVNDLIQDHEGYIWVATGYGLNKFDGINFRNYYTEDGLLNNKIHSLFEDRDEHLWIGTDGGVNIMVGDSLMTRPELDPLKSSSILDIYQDLNGDIWFATDGQGVWYYDVESNLLQQYAAVHGLAGDQVRAIEEDPDGALYFATRQGLTRLYNGNFRTFTTKNGLPDDNLRDIVWDSVNQGLWIATRSGLSLFKQNKFTNYTHKDGLVNNRIQSLAIDHNGGVWIGTEEGVSYLKDGRFRNYTSKDGLVNHIIHATLYDRENNIWFGTFGGGMVGFHGEIFKNFTIEEGLPNNVLTSFTQDDAGNIWLSTYGGGIARYDGKNFEILNEDNGLIDDKVYNIIYDHRGRLLIGTRWGLSIYDHGKFKNFDEKALPYRKIRSLAESKIHPGIYWLGTYGDGLLRFDGEHFKRYTEDDGLANNIIMAIQQEDDGTLWLATYGGVSRYKNGTFKNFTIEDGLPNNGVLDVSLDPEGGLWIATFGGLAYYKNGKIQDAITTGDGLADNVCYFIERDVRGKYWIGTNKGVIRFDYNFYKEHEQSPERVMAFKQFTSDQGLVGDEMNAGAVFRDREGILWFGSVAGMSRFNPESIRENNVAPLIHIDHVQVSDETIKPKNDRVFKNSQNSIRFNFIGICMTAPKQVLYEYRLKGIEKKWQQTMDRQVRYSALPPGEYSFQVKARNADGVWSVDTASMRFTILAPIWQRWWFLVLVLIALGGVVLFIYNYYRVKKQVELERMRVRISSDLHDDVGSALTEIALQSDFLQTAHNLDENIKDSLTQIGSQSRKIVSSLDDIVWSIDARNDSMGDLTDRMQDYVNQVLTPQNIQVYYHFDDLDMKRKLPVEVRENIYLIFKEAINNIAKHSKGDRVDIELVNGSGGFRMKIHDNGENTRNGRKSGHGLRNIKMRAERINARVSFENGEGFSVNVYGNKW